MIPNVQDYPFDPTKLVNLPEGFDGVAVEMKGPRLHIDFVEGNYAGESEFPSMTTRQRKMRRAIKRGKVSVRLCHLILYPEGYHEWEVTDNGNDF
jgi:hypothetical protein